MFVVARRTASKVLLLTILWMGVPASKVLFMTIQWRGVSASKVLFLVIQWMVVPASKVLFMTVQWKGAPASKVLFITIQWMCVPCNGEIFFPCVSRIWCSITFGVRSNSEEEVFCTQFFFHFRVSEKRRRRIRGRPKGYRRMGKRNGYLPETPVFKGTTNVSLALRQRKWRLAIFVAVCCLDLLFATVINSFTQPKFISEWISAHLEKFFQ